MKRNLRFASLHTVRAIFFFHSLTKVARTYIYTYTHTGLQYMQQEEGEQ